MAGPTQTTNKHNLYLSLYQSHISIEAIEGESSPEIDQLKLKANACTTHQAALALLEKIKASPLKDSFNFYQRIDPKIGRPPRLSSLDSLINSVDFRIPGYTCRHYCVIQ